MIRLGVRVRREDAELVLAELLELVPAGLEELELEGGLIEYGLYGAPGELPQLGLLRACVGEALVDVDSRAVADDWAERWRSFHRPVLIEVPGAPALHVRPPWEGPSELSGALEIVIDPAQAFGTGAHHTTRLCLELLLGLRAQEQRRRGLLDIGTGSGVLAIAARKLGLDPVDALDDDPQSISAARENAAVNGVALNLHELDLCRDPLPGAGAQSIITANLLRPLLLALAERLALAPAHLIAGGLLTHELDEVSAAFAQRLGLRERERRSSAEWGALWLVQRSESSLLL